MYPDPPSSPNPSPDEPNGTTRPLPERHRSSLRPGHVFSKLAQIVWLVVVLIVLLLIVRVVFALIGANAENEFASFIYGVTVPFVEPFRGLLQVGEYQIGVSRMEFETVIAIFVYLVAGWGITAAIKVLGR